MKVKYINPFIDAAQGVFRDFVGIDIRPRKPFIFNPRENLIHYDISGIIGLAGEVLGLVIISFPKLAALKIVGKVIKSDVKIFDDVVALSCRAKQDSQVSHV